MAGRGPQGAKTPLLWCGGAREMLLVLLQPAELSAGPPQLA